MALSYYSNWDSFQQMDSDIAIADSKLLPEAWNYDCFFDPNDFFLEKPNSLLHDFSYEVPYNDLSSIAAEAEPFLLPQELEPLPYPKRQKACDFEQVYTDCSQFNPTFFNGGTGASCKSQVRTPFLVSTPCLLQDYSLAGIPALPPLPDFPSLPRYAAGSFDSSKKEPTVGSLSAQSVAARHRRRRITEKTQELGKLVPGGQKMNTAEMFQAAYKYIKYLQAQVGLLELIASNNQENAEVPFESSSDEFQILLESPLIQEKLYSSENCLVPQKFLEQLRSDKEV